MDIHENLRAGCRIIPDTVDELTYLKHIARYNFAVNYVRGKKVLDIGSGTGYGSHLLAGAGATSVVGLDVSTESVAYAQAQFRDANLSFRTGDAQRLDLPDASIDVVVSFEAIEHVQAPERLLDEAARVLSPGGLLILSTPNRRFSSPFRPQRRPINPFHVQEWLPDDFYAMLRTRFGQVKKYGQVFIPYPRQQVLETFCRQRLHRWLVKPAYHLVHGTRYHEATKRIYRAVCGPDRDRHGNVPTTIRPSQTSQSLRKAQEKHFCVDEMGEHQEVLVLLAVCSQALTSRTNSSR